MNSGNIFYDEAYTMKPLDALKKRERLCQYSCYSLTSSRSVQRMYSFNDEAASVLFSLCRRNFDAVIHTKAIV